MSISNIKENDLNLSSNNEEILPVTAEINYEAQVTDIGDGKAQESVLQISIADLLLCCLIKLVITRKHCSLLMYLVKAN